MKKFYVYILYSEKLNRFYTGQTQDVEKRLIRHNNGYERYTSRGIPWELKCTMECDTRADAMKLERKIKNFKSQKRMISFIQEVVGSEK